MTPAPTAGLSLSKAGHWFAAVALAAYLLAVFVLWGQVDANDLDWTRRLYLLAGLEAIAFAAAGAVFGATVQRQSTKREAEGREQAERQVRELAPRAELGSALRATVEAKVAATSPDRPTRFGSSDAEAPSYGWEIGELKAIIDYYDAAPHG